MIKKDFSLLSLDVVSNMSINCKINEGRQFIEAMKYPNIIRTSVCVLQNMTAPMV
jgi:hypothetical protein